MRNTFLDTLFEMAKVDRRITFMTGDLGYGVVEKFMEELPEQFVNAGVAEANMTSVAAGMALSGRIVFTYSIANFPTLRCLEQIRNDVCYHDASVKVVSIGGGFAYGAMGATHHAVEDLSVMRALPNMTVVAPGDPIEARAATRALVAMPGPGYLRLGKAGEPEVHSGDVDFAIGRAIRLRDGCDVTLISTGGMLRYATQAAELLASDGIQARVLSMHTVKPIDVDAILAAVRETSAILSIEEHSLIGGLGSAVSEVLAEQVDRLIPFRRLALPSVFTTDWGSQAYMLRRNGLDPAGIAASVESLLRVPAMAVN